MTEQLIFDFNLPTPATFTNYVAGANAEVVTFLSKTFMARKESYVYLWGAAGVGKTHLLQACCQDVLQRGETAFYLDLSEAIKLKTEILEGIERYDLVCLDNLTAIKADIAWQEALFYLYNRCRDQGTRLIIAADCAPAAVELQLADLQSRLSWGLILQLQELEDIDKIQALQLRAKLKGIKLQNEVAHYILTHHSRDMQALMQLLDQIDKQSLVEKRRVTIPFLRDLLTG